MQVGNELCLARGGSSLSRLPSLFSPRLTVQTLRPPHQQIRTLNLMPERDFSNNAQARIGLLHDNRRCRTGATRTSLPPIPGTHRKNDIGKLHYCGSTGRPRCLLSLLLRAMPARRSHHPAICPRVLRGISTAMCKSRTESLLVLATLSTIQRLTNANDTTHPLY